MATFTKFYCFTEDVAEKKHNLATDTLKFALTNVAPSQTNTVLANITEIAYTNLSSRTVTITSSSQTTGVYKLVANDLVLTASGAVATFRYIVLYNDTEASDALILYGDLGSAISLVSPQTLTIDLDQVGGLLTLT